MKKEGAELLHSERDADREVKRTRHSQAKPRPGLCVWRRLCSQRGWRACPRHSLDTSNGGRVHPSRVSVMVHMVRHTWTPLHNLAHMSSNSLGWILSLLQELLGRRESLPQQRSAAQAWEDLDALGCSKGLFAGPVSVCVQGNEQAGRRRRATEK